MEPDFSKLHISDEFGRASFFYHPYIVAQVMLKTQQRWPVSFGSVLVSRNHQCKFYSVYRDERDFDKYLDEYLKNKSLFRELHQYIENTVAEDLKLIGSVSFEKVTNAGLAEVLAGHYKYFADLISTAWLLRSMDRAIVARLCLHFPKSEDFNEIFSVISVSEKKSFAAEKDRELLQAALAVKKKKAGHGALKKAVLPIYEKYRHATLGYFTEPAETLEAYVKQVIDYSVSPERELREQEEKEARELRRKEKVLSRRSLNSPQRLLIQAGAESAWYKDFYKFNVNRIIMEVEPIFETIAKHTGVALDLLKDMTLEEVTALLQGKQVDLDFVRERIRHSIFVVYSPYFKLLVGGEADAFEKKFLKDDSSGSVFTGRVACRGKVSGPVKVVLGPQDFHKISQGDIIAVTNTSPDFVPVLRKVSAIIAEEGGITAHVSVVSRELGVPAVIGVRRITSVLKDGDMVEVDADKGIVRIIKNKTKL